MEEIEDKCMYREPGTCGGGWPCKLEKGHSGNHVEWDACRAPISDRYDKLYGCVDHCHLILGHEGNHGYGLAGPRGPKGPTK